MKNNRISYVAALALAGSLLNAGTLNLQSGWNLISIPSEGAFSKANINNLEDIGTFNGTAPIPGFLVNTLENGKGYWVKVSQNTDIQYIDGTVSIPTMTAGWNLVGLPAIATLDLLQKDLITKGYKLGTIGSFNGTAPIPGFLISSINNQKGYWIEALKELKSPSTIANTNAFISAYTDKPAGTTNKTITVTINNGTTPQIISLDVPTDATKVYVRISDASNVTKSEYLITDASTVTAVNWNSQTGLADFNLNDVAGTSSTAYTAYYAAAGSAPQILTNIDVYSVEGGTQTFIGKTDSNGRISISDGTYKDKALSFVKEGYATVTVKHAATGTNSVFMSVSNKSTASAISTTVGAARVLKKSLLRRGLANVTSTVKTMQNSSGTFKANFSGFEVVDANKSIKLALLNPSNIAIDGDLTNVAAFALELVSIDANGLETTLPNAAYTSIDSSTATAPSVSFNLTLDKVAAEQASKATSTKANAANKLTLFGFDGTSWSNVASASFDLNGTKLTVNGTTNFTQYVAAYKPAETAKNYPILIKDQDGMNVEAADVILMNKSFYDVNSSMNLSAVLPSSGIVDVEVFADGYDYFTKSIKLTQDVNTTIQLKKQSEANAKDYSLVVKDIDGVALKNAKVKMEVPVVLSSVNVKEGTIYVGKAAGATYAWSVIPLGEKDGFSIDSAKSNSLQQSAIFTTLKANSKESGAFDIKVKVTHQSGFVEEGIVSFLDIIIDANKIVNFNSITSTGFDGGNDLEQNLETDEYIWQDGDNTFGYSWKLSQGTKSEIFSGEEIILDDIAYFLSKHSITSGEVTANVVDSDNIVKDGHSVTIPLLSKTIEDVADIYSDVFSATAVPSVIESETSDDGSMNIEIPSELEFALSVQKGGYKSFAAKRKLSDTSHVNTENQLAVTLDKLDLITGFNIKVYDTEGVAISSNAITFEISDAVLKSITRNGTASTLLTPLKHTASFQASTGFDIDTITTDLADVTTGLVEGTKKIKVFADGYMPYEGRLRVSDRKKEIAIKLQALSTEQATAVSNIIVPYVDISFADIVNDSLVIKGLVIDSSEVIASSDAAYTGTATLTLTFNDDEKSYPINQDGSFSASFTPKNGLNSLVGIVANKAGKYNSGEQFFEYYNYKEDMTDIATVVAEEQENNATDIVYDEGSVIKTLRHFTDNSTGNLLSRGTFINSSKSFNAKVGFNTLDSNTTLYYYTSTVEEKKLTVSSGATSHDLNVSLNQGMNNIGVVAKNQGIVVDEFNVAVYYEPTVEDKTALAEANINVIFALTDSSNPYTGPYEVIVEEPVQSNGLPGMFLDRLEGGSGLGDTFTIPKPSRVIINAPGYFTEFITVDDSISTGATLSKDLFKEGAIVTAAASSSITLNTNEVFLNGIDSMYENDYAFYNVDIYNARVNPENYTYSWSIGENNTSITECSWLDCNFNPAIYGYKTGNFPVRVNISKDGEVKVSKERSVLIEKRPEWNSVNLDPEIFMPFDVMVADGQQENVRIEINDWDNGIKSAVVKVADDSMYDKTKIELRPDVNATTKIIPVVWTKNQFTSVGIVDNNNTLFANISVIGKESDSYLKLEVEVTDKDDNTVTREMYVSTMQEDDEGILEAPPSTPDIGTTTPITGGITEDNEKPEINIYPDFDAKNLVLSTDGVVYKQVEMYDPDGYIDEATIEMKLDGEPGNSDNTVSNDFVEVAYVGYGSVSITGKAAGTTQLTFDVKDNKGLAADTFTMNIEVKDASAFENKAPQVDAANVQINGVPQTPNSLDTYTITQHSQIDIDVQVSDDSGYPAIEWEVQKDSQKYTEDSYEHISLFAYEAGVYTFNLTLKDFEGAEFTRVFTFNVVEQTGGIVVDPIDDISLVKGTTTAITLPFDYSNVSAYSLNTNIAVAEVDYQNSSVSTTSVKLEALEVGEATVEINVFDSTIGNDVVKQFKVTVTEDNGTTGGTVEMPPQVPDDIGNTTTVIAPPSVPGFN